METEMTYIEKAEALRKVYYLISEARNLLNEDEISKTLNELIGKISADLRYVVWRAWIEKTKFHYPATIIINLEEN